MKYRLSVSSGMASRDDVKSIEASKYGFCWWLWKPTRFSNGGKFKQNEIVDVSINWLCFWIDFTFWPNIEGMK